MYKLKKSDFHDAVYLTKNYISNGHWMLPRCLVMNRDLFNTKEEDTRLTFAGVPNRWVSEDPALLAVKDATKIYNRTTFALDYIGKDPVVAVVLLAEDQDRVVLFDKNYLDRFNITQVRGTADVNAPVVSREGVILMPCRGDLIAKSLIVSGLQILAVMQEQPGVQSKK